MILRFPRSMDSILFYSLRYLYEINKIIYIVFLYSIICSKVSDGLQSSQPVSLRITVIPLIVELVNNTGAVLPHNSSVIINTSHLAVTTNAEDPLFQIIFKVYIHLWH